MELNTFYWQEFMKIFIPFFIIGVITKILEKEN